MANRTDRRGNGFAAKAIKIKAADGQALRDLLRERHGYSAEEAIPGIISGELATVLLDTGVRWRLIAWLESQPENADPMVEEGIRSIAAQLRRAAELNIE